MFELVAGPPLWEASQRKLVLHRVARAKTSKLPEVLERASELTDHINATHGKAMMARLYWQRLGETGTLHWFIEHTDMPAWGKSERVLLADETYRSLWASTFEHVVEGTTEEHLLDRL